MIDIRVSESDAPPDTIPTLISERAVIVESYSANGGCAIAIHIIKAKIPTIDNPAIISDLSPHSIKASIRGLVAKICVCQIHAMIGNQIHPGILCPSSVILKISPVSG